MDKFTKDLDTILQAEYSEKIKNMIVENNLIRVEVFLCNDSITRLLNSYDLQYIELSVRVNSYFDSNIIYYYKGGEVKPISQWLASHRHNEVSTIQLLKECMNQDTNTPDIKALQDGEK